MRTLFALGLTLMLSFSAYSYTIKEPLINSTVMGKGYKATVVVPDSYDINDNNYPTIYVLHGWSGNYQDWLKNSNIATLADQYQLILIMPDGNYDKWYIDSPIDKNSQFETYISSEVVNAIDKEFRTIASKKARAITGLSMGGFGALNIALNHQNQFGAVGSMSGGVDPRSFAKNWGLINVFGDPIDNANFWHDKAIINNAHHFIFSGIKVIIDCGVDDFFINTNRQLHKKLLELKIPHDYIERDGGHTWNYWNNAIKYQIQFLSNALETKQAVLSLK
ncbi:alpha/beta hydrolase family protein [Orbus sturtevantii]|uniref:alpha/beta hydrolase n=1 Tax=Orbus sturtevantii TaxID=3074109 RepID=UPI00370CFD3E